MNKNRYKEALAMLDSDQRTCILFLEKLIRENHLQTLKAIPKKDNVDLSILDPKFDSLQKQIDTQKSKIDNVSKYVDDEASREQYLKSLLKETDKFRRIADEIKWIREESLRVIESHIREKIQGDIPNMFQVNIDATKIKDFDNQEGIEVTTSTRNKGRAKRAFKLTGKKAK